MITKNLKNYILAGAGLIALTGAIFVVKYAGGIPPSKQLVKAAQPEKPIETAVTIYTDKNKTQKIFTEIQGKTALDLTRETTGEQIETSGEGINAYVTSLLGRKADSKKREFWEMFVNGQSSLVGAGSYVVTAGDEIEWKLSNY